MSNLLTILQAELRRRACRRGGPDNPDRGFGRLILTCYRLCSVLLPLALLLILTPGVQAAELQIVSKTILRSFDRDTVEKNEADVVPLYEYLQLDYEPTDSKGLSFHFQGWGRVAHDDGDYFNKNSRGELIYGYLEYPLPFSPTNLKLGRMHIFDGVSNESIDGLRVQTDLSPEWSASIYGGFPVSLETTDGRSGDSIFGGRISWQQPGQHKLGLSYKVLSNDGKLDEELLGLDFSLTLPNILLLGMLTRNLDINEWAEQTFEARFAKGAFEFRPSYTRYESDGYFSGNRNLYQAFKVQAELKSTTQIVGTEAFWYPSESIEVGVKVKHYDYEKRFGNAQYYSGIFTYKWNILSQLGAELGRMDGDDPENRYLLGRCFFFLDQKTMFLTADMLYTHYDEEYLNEDHSLFASLGIGWKLFEEKLRIKLSTDYTSDPYYDYDHRYLLVVDYLFEKSRPGR